MLLFLLPFVLSATENARSHFFIENKSQWSDNILYKVKMDNARVFMEKDRLTFMLISPQDLEDMHLMHHNPGIFPNGVTIDYHAYTVHFLNANPDPQLEASDKLSAYHNYFLGNDPSKWSGHVGLYHQVRYRELYDHIDYQLYFHEDKLKYDLIAKPGADLSQVKFNYEGLDYMYLDASGDLVLMNSVNDVYEMHPVAWQVIGGWQIPVSCRYVLNGEQLSFEFPDGYDTSAELIVDPGIVFSTYTGSEADNWGSTATYDTYGNAYGGGMAFQMIGDFVTPGEYPTTPGAFQETFQGGDPNTSQGGSDMSVAKFTPDGSDLIYSTYLGGSSDEFPHSMIVNNAGNLVIYGTTSSLNFPVGASGFDNDHNGGPATGLNGINYSNGADIVLVILSEDGSSLLSGTFIGGTGSDGLNQATSLAKNYGDQARGEIIVDAADNIYLASTTQSFDLTVTPGAFQTTPSGGTQDGFVMKLTPDLTQIVWGSYIGGSNVDGAYSVKLDENENLYVCGGTQSSDFPYTQGAYNASGYGGTDGWIAHISNDGSQILNCTAIGSPGNAYDQAYLLDIDTEGNVYVFGQTEGTYPVSGTSYLDPGSGQFIHKFSGDLATSVWSTLFGSGIGLNISPTAFLVDNCRRIYVSGWGGLNSVTNTSGMNLTPDAFQSTTDGADFYFAVFSEDMGALEYATYFGANGGTGDHVDGGTSRFDKQGVIYEAVCASCGSGSGFPTTPGAFSEVNNSLRCNLALIKFAFESENVVADFVQQPGGCAPQTFTFQNNSVNAISYHWDFGDGSSSNEVNPSITYDEPGSYFISLIAMNPESCNLADTSSYVVNITSAVVMADFEVTTSSICAPAAFSFENTSSGANQYLWDFGDGTASDQASPSHTYTEGGNYTVVLTASNSGDCPGQAIHSLEISVISPPDASLAAIEDVCGTDHLLPIMVINGGDFDVTSSLSLLITTYENETTLIENLPLGSSIDLPSILDSLGHPAFETILATVHTIVGNEDCTQELSESFTVKALPIINYFISDCFSDNTGMLSLNINVENYHSCLGAPVEAYTLTGTNGTVQINEANPLNLPFVLNLAGDASTYEFILHDMCTGCSTGFSVSLPQCVICHPDAGTMPTPMQIACAGESVSALATGTFIEPGQMLIYALHTSSTAAAGNVLATNTTGTFYLSDAPLADYNVIYYISSIVGYPYGGGIDLDDPCTAVAQGTPVLFLEPIHIIVNEICDWAISGDFNIVFTAIGGYPAYNPTALYSYTGPAIVSAPYGQSINAALGQFDGFTYAIQVSDVMGCSGNHQSAPVICYKTPVEWMGMDIEMLSTGNALTWRVGSETDNDYFAVEWSRDGISFVPVQNIYSLGNTQSIREYAYVHPELSYGEHFYRINQVDHNGRHTYSEILSLFRTAEDGQMLVFPIPSSDRIQVILPVNEVDMASYRIYDISGKIVSKGENTSSLFQIDISYLVCGHYYLQVNAGEIQWQNRIIKQ